MYLKEDATVSKTSIFLEMVSSWISFWAISSVDLSSIEIGSLTIVDPFVIKMNDLLIEPLKNVLISVMEPLSSKF